MGRYEDYELELLKWRWWQIQLQRKYGNTPPGFRGDNREEQVKKARKEWLADVKAYRESRRNELIQQPPVGPEIFVGREQELAQIEAGFKKKCGPVVLAGMGGIGKSALAREYARRKSQSFDQVLFLYYEESLQHIFADDSVLCISNLQYSIEKYKNHRAYFLYKLEQFRKILKDKNVLLVIDNFDVLKERDMQRIFALPCDILITTRVNPDHWKREEIPMEILRVDGIEEEENQRELIREYCREAASPEDEEELLSYCRQVEGHALLTILKIKAVRGPFVELKDFRQHLFDCYHLKKAQKDALAFLCVMPVMGIPLGLFSMITGIEREVVFYLESQSLIESRRLAGHCDEIISLHPLIAEAARESFPCNSIHFNRLISGMSDCLNGKLDGMDSWERPYLENQRLQPYVSAILRSLPSFMPWLAAATDTLITFLWIQQYFKAAETYSLRLYKSVEDYYGKKHQITGEMALRTAAVYYNETNYELADVWYLKACEIFKACTTQNQDYLLMCSAAYKKLARSCYHKGHYEEALKDIDLALKELSMYQQKAEETEEMGWAYESSWLYFHLLKAKILLNCRRIKESRALYMEIKNKLPQRITETFRMNEFECFEIDLLLQTGDMEKAYDLAVKTWKRARIHCGANFKDTLSCEEKLAQICMLTGREEEGIRHSTHVEIEKNKMLKFTLLTDAS